MKEIGFDGLIANLGAYIEYNGTRVFEREMPTDLAWNTVEIIKANGFIPVLEGNDYMYYNLDEYTSDIDWFADLITQELGDNRRHAAHRGRGRHLDAVCPCASIASNLTTVVASAVS